LETSHADQSDIDSDGQSDHGVTSALAAPFDNPRDLVDIAPVSEAYLAEPGDHVEQSTVLENIITTTLHDAADLDPFEEKSVYKLRLSKLQKLYENRDPQVVDLLLNRHKIVIDKHFRLEFGKREILLDTSQTMIDYQLVVANSIGFEILLPNAASDHRFCFNMDLKKPNKLFKGKHGMVGFDTKARMLYLGRANNEDVYLAMAPNEFLRGHSEMKPAGYSTGPSVMSRRHYRQIVMMLAHFLSLIPQLAYITNGEVYDQDLEREKPRWSDMTNIMYVHIFPSYVLSIFFFEF